MSWRNNWRSGSRKEHEVRVGIKKTLERAADFPHALAKTQSLLQKEEIAIPNAIFSFSAGEILTLLCRFTNWTCIN